MRIDSTKPPPHALRPERQHQLTDVPIVHTLYVTYRLWHDLVLKFPKSERYALGQTCGQTLLAILERILAAAGIADRIQKLEHLRLVSTKLDILRLLVRLCKDTRCISNEAYLAVESKLHETGRMLGGWIKSLSGTDNGRL
ncbi:four helix bundle protein [Candidatus Uhrbacteria bacterium]|nr:four helix bundle protein [Candidatus Uhrbacteria bacterium]